MPSDWRAIRWNHAEILAALERWKTLTISWRMSEWELAMLQTVRFGSQALRIIEDRTDSEITNLAEFANLKEQLIFLFGNGFISIETYDSLNALPNPSDLQNALRPYEKHFQKNGN